MSNVPRIEAFHADQAVTICCEVLTFIARSGKALSDQEETLPPHNEILSGLGLAGADTQQHACRSGETPDMGEDKATRQQTGKKLTRRA